METVPEWLAAFGRKYGRLVFVSDTHLGTGTNPKTGRVSPFEDFLPQVQERQFRRMLESFWAAAEVDGEVRTLVLNGDVIEHDLSEEGPYPGLATTVGTRWSEPGKRRKLMTGEDGDPIYTARNAQLKTLAAWQGHPGLFTTLAEHVKRGHRLRISWGNHDRLGATPSGLAAMRWSLRRDLASLLQRDGWAAREAIQESRRLIEERVDFDAPYSQHGDVAWGHGHWNDPLSTDASPYAAFFARKFARDEPQPVDFGHRVARSLYRPMRLLTSAGPRDPELTKRALVAGARRALGTLGLVRAALGVFRNDGAPSPEVAAQLAAAERDRVRRVVNGGLLDQQREVGDPSVTAEEVAERLLALEDTRAPPLLNLFREGTQLRERVWIALANVRTLLGAFPAIGLEARTLPSLVVLAETLRVGTFIRSHEHIAGIDESYLVGDPANDPRLIRLLDSASWLGDQRGVIEVRYDEQGSHASPLQWDDAKGQLVPMPTRP